MTVLRCLTKDGRFRMQLEGRDVHVCRLRPHGDGQVVPENLGILAKWSFVHQAIEVHFEGMTPALIERANEVFGRHLRSLDPPRQGSLFPAACSVCGADRNTFPETLTHDNHGNVFSVAPDEPVRWQCGVCNRLVCRHCTLVAPSGRYYHHTYCSESCRAANPDGWDEEDELMD